MKYLVVGLGNPGEEYFNTRHNIGFIILDALAKASNIFFTPDRYAFRAEMKYKGRTLILIKPSTFMNLSGKAVNYWLQQEKISLENLLVVADDIALPLGTLRMRAKGSDGGHNGLKNITEMLCSSDYPRLRIGIGNDFGKGQQANYVLGQWTPSEIKTLETRIPLALEAIKGFATAGIMHTMNVVNNK